MPRLSLDQSRCLACRSCEIACVVQHSRAGTLAGAITESPAPHRRVTVAAGPTGAEALRCAECVDPLTGRTTISGIWPVAHEMGRAAGMTAVGMARAGAGALLHGDVTQAGDFYRRYREAASRPAGAERGT